MIMSLTRPQAAQLSLAAFLPLTLDGQRSGATHRLDSSKRRYAGETLPPFQPYTAVLVLRLCSGEEHIFRSDGGCPQTETLPILDVILEF